MQWWNMHERSIPGYNENDDAKANDGEEKKTAHFIVRSEWKSECVDWKLDFDV